MRHAGRLAHLVEWLSMARPVKVEQAACNMFVKFSNRHVQNAVIKAWHSYYFYYFRIHE